MFAMAWTWRSGSAGLPPEWSVTGNIHCCQPGGGWISGGLGIVSGVSCEALRGGSGGMPPPPQKCSKIDIKICIFVPFQIWWGLGLKISQWKSDFYHFRWFSWDSWNNSAGGWDLLKYSGNSRMILEGWQHWTLHGQKCCKCYIKCVLVPKFSRTA